LRGAKILQKWCGFLWLQLRNTVLNCPLYKTEHYVFSRMLWLIIKITNVSKYPRRIFKAVWAVFHKI
jgi:hypothetical protein